MGKILVRWIRNKIVTKSQIKDKRNLREFPSKIWFRSGIHSLRRRNDERCIADVICIIWRISQYAPYAQ